VRIGDVLAKNLQRVTKRDGKNSLIPHVIRFHSAFPKTASAMHSAAMSSVSFNSA